MTELNRIYFRIPIGDYSSDGHGKCDYFAASSALSLNEVREAYFKAKEELPKIICPENFVNQYEEYEISDEVVQALKDAGYTSDDENFYTDFGTGEMAEYVVWYINKGNSSCDIKLEPKINDMFPFYGHDEKNRHIGFIGYGLLGT